jgi:glycosyltransferase involved in cell wall biosynthesis
MLARLKSLIGISTPKPPPHHLQLNGTVYASILNPRDSRKNWVDMTSAFVGAFRERTDVTLLLKFNEHSSDDSFSQLEFLLRRNLPMKCRVIAFNGYLDDKNFSSFLGSINYVVNASSGEGQCLPLMELMSMGTPALAPLNTSMEDYVTSDNAFIVRSELEPAIWPQDTRAMVRGHQYRISWQSLCEAFQLSKHVIDTQPERYAAMGRQAREVLKQHCSHAIAVERMRGFLASLHL